VGEARRISTISARAGGVVGGVVTVIVKVLGGSEPTVPSFARRLQKERQ